MELGDKMAEQVGALHIKGYTNPGFMLPRVQIFPGQVEQLPSSYFGRILTRNMKTFQPPCNGCNSLTSEAFCQIQMAGHGPVLAPHVKRAGVRGNVRESERCPLF